MLSQYLKMNSGTGLSVQINNDNSVEMQACKIVVKKHFLSFEKKLLNLKSLEELTEHIAVNSLIALNLNGKGILHKRVDKIQEITAANFFQILPNANIHEFYVQNFISGDKSFVSVIRKTEAEKWFEQCRNLRLIPVMLSLGPYPVHIILPQLNVYGETLVFNGHVMQRNLEGEWESIQYQPGAAAAFPFKLENEPIDEKLLIPYASAFQLLFAEVTEVTLAKVPSLENEFRKVISKKRNQVLMVTVVVGWSLILLANFFIYSSLRSRNKQLALSAKESAYTLQEYSELENNIKAKEIKLADAGWDGGANKAFIIDQLAADLPEEISWDEISINPAEDKISGLQNLFFADRTIRVSGFSDRIIPVNDWVMTIKNRKWINDVQLQSYVFNADVNKGQFVVLIKF